MRHRHELELGAQARIHSGDRMQGFRASGVSTGVDDLTELLLDDPRVRWSAVAAVAIVWLTAAWGEVAVLALLGVPGSIVWLARKHPLRDEPELNDLL